MIYETIITTTDAEGTPHIAPFGIQKPSDGVVISPFRPSITLDNILSTRVAVMNLTDDVRVFASAVARKASFPLVPTTSVTGYRLASTLAHQELALVRIDDDPVRPQLVMRVVSEHHHQAFAGFNRAQAAVIELAVLTSRLPLLPKEKVETERRYLQIAIDKTAGERELEAWQWLVDTIDNFYATQQGNQLA